MNRLSNISRDVSKVLISKTAQEAVDYGALKSLKILAEDWKGKFAKVGEGIAEATFDNKEAAEGYERNALMEYPQYAKQATFTKRGNNYRVSIIVIPED